ncbi:MAG: hypothetical protein ACPG05_05585 [Bdellovibrionales bacterium]
MKYALILSASTLLLTACTNPNWAGDGYTWNDNSPISSPAKTSSWNEKTQDNHPEKTVSRESVISGVSADIADSLEAKLSRTTPIYLAPKQTKGAKTSIFDHTLRTKLKQKGYTLSSTPNGAYTLVYDIEKAEREEGEPKAYNFLVLDISGEEPVIVEQRTQELPPLKK